ncbi:MAG: hypothetical protein R2839_08885 [Thermomicrobiales bacterium]
MRLAAELLNKAKRPLFMAGHGILISGAEDSFAKLVDQTGVPTIFTLLGLGSLPESHPQALGLMGMHGHRHANKALEECDLLVNIGARFDDRATGKVADFAPKAKVVHVDIDPAEIGKNVRTDVPVVGDARQVINVMLQEVEPRTHDAWLSWIESQAMSYWRPLSRNDRRGQSHTRSSNPWVKPPAMMRSFRQTLGSTRCGRLSIWESNARTAG